MEATVGISHSEVRQSVIECINIAAMEQSKFEQPEFGLVDDLLHTLAPKLTPQHMTNDEQYVSPHCFPLTLHMLTIHNIPNMYLFKGRGHSLTSDLGINDYTGNMLARANLISKFVDASNLNPCPNSPDLW